MIMMIIISFAQDNTDVDSNSASEQDKKAQSALTSAPNNMLKIVHIIRYTAW